MRVVKWCALALGLGLGALVVSCMDMGDTDFVETPEAGKDTGVADAPRDTPTDVADAPKDSASDGASDARVEAGETGGKIWEVRVGNAAITDGGPASKAFVPDSLNVAVGDTVKWIWDEDGHNVMSGDPTTCTPDLKFCSPSDTTCNKPPVSLKGSVYTHQFNAAGMYMYYCRPHCGDGMSGMIVVK